MGYTDFQKPHFYHLCKILDQFVFHYLTYGILSRQNIFSNNYWWINNSLIRIQSSHLQLNKYYRKVRFIHEKLEINEEYYLRTSVKFLSLTKVQFLKYQNWFIIRLYYFQPQIKKLTLKKTKRNFYSFLSSQIFANKSLQRIRLFFVWINALKKHESIYLF